jgi:hypothetical protein
MRTYKFSWKKKPWWKRIFSREKYEWGVDVEVPTNPEIATIVIGSMYFQGTDMSYNVNVYEDGTSVIYKNDKRNI